MENIEKNKKDEQKLETENINTAPDEENETLQPDVAVTDASENELPAEDVAEASEEESAEPEAQETVQPAVIDDEELTEYGDEDGDDGDEDISKVAERITRIRHSMVTSSGSIRTRSPEQNRSITNGIPVRRSSATASNEAPAVVSDEKNGKMFNILILCAIALLVLIAAVVVLINVLNVEAAMRPADHNITGEPADTEGVTVPDPVAEPTQFNVKLDFYSRKDIALSTTETTLGQLLESIGCRLAENEQTSVPLDTVINCDMVITVDTYEYKTETVSEVIPFEVENIETDLIMKGTSETREGEDGAKTTEYRIEYVNGVEVERTVISENITKEPVNELNQIGVGGEITGADGKTYTYSMKQIVTAKYYSLEGLTWLNFEADETVVTVADQAMLGTKLYVKNGEYDLGSRIIADVSRNLKDGEIYIWISKSNPDYAELINAVHTDMEIYYID